MKRYRELLAIPHAWSLLIAAAPARTAYGMISLSIFFKAQRETGSVAAAGFAISLNAIAGAFTAGIRGSILDRFGQRWPLRVFVPSYSALILVLNSMHDREAIFLVAFILGITAPPINLSIRPLWKTIAPGEYLRVAYALDTASMNLSAVVGPVFATTLSLSSNPSNALIVTSALMFIGGMSLNFNYVSRNWKPEKKDKDAASIFRHKPLQLLMLEGCFVGLGWGLFDVGVPSFATLEGVPQKTALIFGAMASANVLGGLIAGLVSKNSPALPTLRKTYGLWFFVSLPIAFTYPGPSMLIAGAALGLVGGAIQVFYWEVMEAVRPKGSPTAMMGWLWTVEGSMAALGSALGGWVSETFSPRVCLGTTTLCLGIGWIVLYLGRGLLSPANKIPTSAEDINAMEENIKPAI